MNVNKVRRTARTALPHPLRRRPLVELLENRCVPSTVTNLTDHDAGSLRDAIATTPSGGTVDFQPGLTGTITLTTGELAVAKNLTIAGPGASVITVSGSHASRVFDIAPSVTVAIVGLTVADGTGSAGGGILNFGTLTIANCIVSGNVAGSGGGINNWNGIMNITGTTINDNRAFPFGGGIENTGTLTITDSTLTGNLASNGLDGVGGAIDNGPGGTLSISNCALNGNAARGEVLFGMASGGAISSLGPLTITHSTLSDNAAIGGSGAEGGAIEGNGTTILSDCIVTGNSVTGDAEGGGIFITNNGRLNLTKCTLSHNSATGNPVTGGGIHNAGGMVIITDSTLNDNTANSMFNAYGGGIYNVGNMTVTDSTLSSNSTNGQLGGGAIFNSRTLTLTGCTLSDNSATAIAAGIRNNGLGTITLRNTIVARNMAPSAPDVTGVLASQGHNLIGDGNGGNGFVDTDLVGTADFPIDPELEPFGEYGGPTETMRPLPGSPVINSGDNTDAPDTDQRGFPRVVLGFIDIGAVELQPDEFGGQSGSTGAQQVSTFHLADSPATGTNTEASACAAPAAETKSITVDHSRLDALFGLLGSGVRQREGVALDFAPHLRSKGGAEPLSWAWFDGVAAVHNNP